MSVREDLILDISQAQRSIDQLERQLTKVSGRSLEINTNAEDVIKEIRSIEDRLAGLDDDDRNVVIRASIDQAQADLRTLERQLGSESLSDKDIRVVIDQRNEASRKLDQLRAELGDVEDQARRTSLGIGDIALTGGAALGLAKITTVAAEAEQAIGGLSSVFKSATGDVEAFVSQADQLAGLSELAARQLTSRLGASLKGLGLDVDEAAAKSVELTRLGADLAATMGGTTFDAVEALGAAFRGEYESLELFGVSLTQAQVDAKAVALGLADTVTAVDQAARAEAAYALILERSADAQGQFAREISTASGQAAVAAAQRANAAVELGENLLPLYTQLSQVAGVAAEVVGALPGPLQALGLGIVGLGAVSRPAKAGIELVSDSVGGLRNRVAGADGGVVGLTSRFAGMVTTIGLVVGASQLLDSTFSDLQKADLSQLENSLLGIRDGIISGEAASVFGDDLSNLSEAIERIADPSVQTQLDNAVSSIVDLGGLLGDSDSNLNQARQRIDDLDKSLASLVSRNPDEARAVFDAILAELPAGADQLPELLDDYSAALAGVDTGQRTAADSTKELIDPIDELRTTVEELTSAYETQFEVLDSQLGLERDFRDSLIGVADAQANLEEIRRQLTSGDLEGAEAARQLRDAQIGVDDASVALAESAAALRVNQLEATGAVVDAQTQARIQAEEYRKVAETLAPDSPLRERLFGLADQLDGLTDEHSINIETAGAEADLAAALARLQRQLDINPLSVDVAIAEKFVIRNQGLQRRRLGGDFVAGGLLVGEGGPELRFESRAGYIVAAGATARLAADIDQVEARIRTLAPRVGQFGLRDFGAAGGGGGRLHPDDIEALAGALARQLPDAGDTYQVSGAGSPRDTVSAIARTRALRKRHR